MDTAQHRFSRFELLIGDKKLNQLNTTKVAVIGLGGVGSYVTEALARSGIGWLILVDYDEISLTNTNRQLLAIQGNYGRSKVETMSERVKAINPEITVVAWKEFLSAENLDTILYGRISYVVDAIDTVSSKVALIEYCLQREIPIISSMGTGDKFDPFALKITDISKTHTCPLAKAVRKMLREHNILKGVKVIFSTEKPVSNQADIITCHTECICSNGCQTQYNCTPKKQIGSTSYLPPIAGLMMAGEVIRDLLQSDPSHSL